MGKDGISVEDVVVCALPDARTEVEVEVLVDAVETRISLEFKSSGSKTDTRISGLGE
jgi:hypothetical protein